MKPLILLLLLAIFSLNCFQVISSNDKTVKLSNGNLATIQLKINTFSESLPLCTGLILSPHLILTRANCLVILSQHYGFNPLLLHNTIRPPMIHSSLLSVQFMLKNNNEGKNKNQVGHRVKHIELHDKFNLFTLERNLALIMLATGNEEDERSGAPVEGTNENSQHVLRRELQSILQEFEKAEPTATNKESGNLIFLSNKEQVSSSTDCSKQEMSSSGTLCKHITYSGEENTLDDSFLFRSSSTTSDIKQSYFPLGIQSYHESTDQHNHRLYYTSLLTKDFIQWLTKIDKQLLLRGETIVDSPLFETYHLSPSQPPGEVEDKRRQISSEIQQRLAEIVNQGPTPQEETYSQHQTRSAPSNTLYETENNLKEISKQLHSKLVNTILGL